MGREGGNWAGSYNHAIKAGNWPLIRVADNPERLLTATCHLHPKSLPKMYRPQNTERPMVNHSNIDTLHVKCTCTDIVKVSTRFKRWGAGLGRDPVKLRGGEKQSSRGSGPTAAPTPGSGLGSMNTVSMSLYDALLARPPAFQRSPGAGREEYFSGLEEQGCGLR